MFIFYLYLQFISLNENGTCETREWPADDSVEGGIEWGKICLEGQVMLQ
jgi:hypothetical protein